MGFRTCTNNEQVEEGDWVALVSPDNGNNGYDNFFEYFFEKQVYGVVHSEKKHERYCVSKNSILVDFAQSTKVLDNISPYKHCRAASLRKLTLEEHDKYAQLALDADLWAKAQIETQKKLMDLPPANENYINRTFRHDDKNALSTALNVVSMGRWDKGADSFSISENHYFEDCCAFTQCDDDMEVFIPDIWLRYYGYTPYDLVEWCKFLTHCGIDFEYEYMGPKDLPKSFGEKIDDYEDDMVNRFSVGKYGSTIYPKGRNGFVAVRIQGNDAAMQSYMKFICLRYMYNHQYWTIPGHAMQIKLALGDLVSYWEALLMAHLYMAYYGYYSLVSQTDFDPSEKYNVNKYSKFSSSCNYDRHVDPFQDRGTVMDNLVGDGCGMNCAFSYTCDAFKREELRKFFDDKDYIGLYNYVKEKTADAKTWRLKGKE